MFLVDLHYLPTITCMMRNTKVMKIHKHKFLGHNKSMIKHIKINKLSQFNLIHLENRWKKQLYKETYCANIDAEWCSSMEEKLQLSCTGNKYCFI